MIFLVHLVEPIHRSDGYQASLYYHPYGVEMVPLQNQMTKCYAVNTTVEDQTLSEVQIGTENASIQLSEVLKTQE